MACCSVHAGCDAGELTHEQGTLQEADRQLVRSNLACHQGSTLLLMLPAYCKSTVADVCHTKRPVRQYTALYSP